MLNKDILKLIIKEVEWAERNKVFPDIVREQGSIFAEEALEVMQEINNYSEPEKHGSLKLIAQESIQAAAVLIRILKRL